MKKILLVEDESVLSEALALKLQKQDYKVVSALNGEEAIECLKSDTYDMVLLDIIMPVMDGMDTLKKIRTDLKLSIPVIVLTNLGNDDDGIKVKELGAQEYLIKADTPMAQVIEVMKKYLV